MLHNDERVLHPEYILIDDLGREYAEPFALSRFEIFIENIYKNKNSIIVLTTNLTEAQFKNREGWARINDRLLELCGWIEIKVIQGGRNERKSTHNL